LREPGYGRPEATARAVIYRFLSRAFLAPSPGIVRELREQVTEVDVSAQLLETIGYRVWNSLEIALRGLPRSDSEIAQLRREYAAIFLSTKPPLIREVAHVRGLEVDELETEYCEIGVTYDIPGLDPDHLSIELDYMHRLALLEALAWKNANPLPILEKELAFLRRHLAAWVPRMARLAAARARSDFYRGLSTLLHHFIVRDVEIVALVADMLSSLKRS